MTTGGESNGMTLWANGKLETGSHDGALRRCTDADFSEAKTLGDIRTLLEFGGGKADEETREGPAAS